ncbi:MAG: cobalamin biosynthesis protein [Salinarimonas sp.]|nr:cobalamin biosynthesis protein [Salinarimonas sp.]
MTGDPERYVIGLGFRGEAKRESLDAVLGAAIAAAKAVEKAKAPAGSASPLLASARDKAESPAMQALAAAHGLPILALDEPALAAQADNVTARETRVTRLPAGASLCEAAALAGAATLSPSGEAELIVARMIGADRMATAAVAIAKTTQKDVP